MPTWPPHHRPVTGGIRSGVPTARVRRRISVVRAGQPRTRRELELPRAERDSLPLNTPFAEGGPSLSPDGRLIFFHSARLQPLPGGRGNDIWASRRADPNDDL